MWCEFIAVNGKLTCRHCKYIYGGPIEDAPRRPCPNSPDLEVVAKELGITTSEVQALGFCATQDGLGAVMAAANKLDWPWALARRHIRKLQRWITAGMPERCSHNECMDALKTMSCENRSIGGNCRKTGCGKNPAKTPPCVCIYRMATEACPCGLFTAVRSSDC